MKSTYLRAVGAGLALTMAAHPVLATDREVTVLAKAGGSYAEREADDRRCDEIAGSAPATDLPQTGARASAMGYGGYYYGMPGYGTLEGAVGVAIGMAIVGAIEENKARGRAAKFCMSNLGYVPVPLTAEEAAEWRGLRGGRKRQWEEAFLAGEGVTARVNTLRASVVAELPGYRVAPATQGGLRFDVASMTAAEAPVAVGVLASGKADRWRTAELTEDFRAETQYGVLTAPAGTVFHQVDYRPQATPLLRDQGATWCGTLGGNIASGPGVPPGVWCFTRQPTGYTVFQPTGQAWLAGVMGNGTVLQNVTTSLNLRERDSDDLPLIYEIRSAERTGFNITIEGSVRNGADRVVLWRQQVSLRDGGRLTLPLWERRLHIARADGLLTATLDDQGDGTGLRG